MRKVRIFVVEYFSAIRKSIRAAIEDTENLELVGEAEDGAGLFAALKITRPDIVLIDVVLPDIDGMEAIREIKRKFSGIEVRAFSLHDNTRFDVEALEAGASVFSLKRADLNKILIAAAEDRLYKDRKAPSHVERLFGAYGLPLTL
jgi:DNA-binding NarL/FixJ family response regulator